MHVPSFSQVRGQQVECTGDIEKQQNRALKQDLNNPRRCLKLNTTSEYEKS